MGTEISLNIRGMSIDWSRNARGADHGALFQDVDRKRIRSDQSDEGSIAEAPEDPCDSGEGGGGAYEGYQRLDVSNHLDQRPIRQVQSPASPFFLEWLPTPPPASWRSWFWFARWMPPRWHARTQTAFCSQQSPVLRGRARHFRELPP